MGRPSQALVPNIVLVGTSVQDPLIRGNAMTLLQVKVANPTQSPQSGRLIGTAKRLRGTLSPQSQEFAVDPGGAISLNLTYDAKSCTVPFHQRSDILTFAIKQNGTTISAGHVNVNVRKVWQDYLNLALRRFRRSLVTLTSVLSVITSGLLVSLWKLGLPGALIYGVALFAGIFAVAVIVASLVLAFILEDETITEGRRWA